jgi:hypothetical protein
VASARSICTLPDHSSPGIANKIRMDVVTGYIYVRLQDLK